MNPQTAPASCLRCGAPVPPAAPGASRAECRYCGAPLGLDGEAPNPGVAGRPSRSPGPKVSPALLWAGLGAVGSLGVGVATTASLRRAEPATGLTTAPAAVALAGPSAEAPSASPVAVAETGITAGTIANVHRGLLVFDADGDGVDDALGLFDRSTPPGGRFFGAVSGADGRAIWSADASGMADDTLLRAWVSGHFVTLDAGGVLRAIDPRAGVERWSRAAGKPVRGLCGGDDALFLETEGGPARAIRVSLVAGEAAVTALPRPCLPVYTSQSDGPNFTIVRGRDAGRATSPADTAMDVVQALLPRVGNARVALGSARATAVPTVSVVANGAVVWSAPVPPAFVAAEPGAASLRAAVRFERLVVAYAGAAPGEGLHVTCFDLGNGARRWDVALPEGLGAGTEVALSKDRRVFVRTTTGRLRVFDGDSGAASLTLGGE